MQEYGEDKQESNSVTSQRTLLSEFVEEQEDLLIYHTYIDDGFTGTDFNRPSFQKLLEDMKQGNINCIIVKDLSRLGRNYIEVGNYIEQVFPVWNIRFIAINDGIDSFKNPMSTNTLLVPFKNLINDEYARDTSIKIRTSLNGKKKRGEFIGAFPSYGYIKDPKDKHKLIIDHSVADVIRKIFDWYVNEGLGKIAICHRLNELGIVNPTGHKKLELKQNYNNSGIQDHSYTWTPSTIRNILSNEIYIGNTVQGKRKTKSYNIHKVENIPQEEWIKVENTHEPIIQTEIFQKAQELKKVDTRVQNSGKLSMWAGILKCADCGKAMNKKYCKNKTGRTYAYYICSTYRKKSNQLCTKHTIKIDELENVVLEAIQIHIQLFINTEEILAQIQKIETNTLKENELECIKQEKEEKVKKLNHLKKGLYEDWKNQDITKAEYQAYKQQYEEEIQKIQKNIQNLGEEKEKQKQILQADNQWLEDFKLHHNITQLDREIITELIDYIEIHENKKITIHFKFQKEQQICE